MFAVFFLRKKYGPPIVVLVGVALLAGGIGVTNHAVTGIIGAALVVVDAAAGVMRKNATLAASKRDPRVMRRSERRRRTRRHPRRIQHVRPNPFRC